MHEAVCNALAEAAHITRELQLDERNGDFTDLLLMYGHSLYSRGMYEAACGNGDKVINIIRELYRLHPGKFEDTFTQPSRIWRLASI